MQNKNDMKSNAAGEETATKNDLWALEAAMKKDLGLFATKQYLERFATKDDLTRFATKQDLERFATKDDLARFATKEDTDRRFDELTTDVSGLKTDVSELRTDVAELRATTRRTAIEVARIGGQMQDFATRAEMAKGFNDVLSKLDDFADEVKASRRERALQDKSFNSLNERLGDHELRLTRIELREKQS